MDGVVLSQLYLLLKKWLKELVQSFYISVDDSWYQSIVRDQQYVRDTISSYFNGRLID